MHRRVAVASPPSKITGIGNGGHPPVCLVERSPAPLSSCAGSSPFGANPHLKPRRHRCRRCWIEERSTSSEASRRGELGSGLRFDWNAADRRETEALGARRRWFLPPRNHAGPSLHLHRQPLLLRRRGCYRRRLIAVPVFTVHHQKQLIRKEETDVFWHLVEQVKPGEVARAEQQGCSNGMAEGWLGQCPLLQA